MRKAKRELNAVYISERVQECLRGISMCPLTAVVAPMGYGKTTAVSWYMKRQEIEEDALTLTVSIYTDNLLVLWQRVQRAFAFAGLDFLTGYDCPEDEGGAAMLTDEICRCLEGERQCYIFIDDFHLLSDARAADFIFRLAMHLPENVHIIVASRDRFLRGSDIVHLGGRLHSIGAGQLRLNYTELSVYARRIGAKLSDEQARELLSSSEGWFSAVYLNLRSVADRGELLSSGSDIYEMFSAALIEPLGEAEQEFLALMSLADEFTADMAGFIDCGRDTDSMLAALTEQNAFISRLPESGAYRFHHMMKDCAGKIFRSFDEEKRKAAFCRYGSWYQQHGEYLQALQAYAGGGDAKQWLRVVAEDAGVMLAAVHPETVMDQLGQCTEAELKGDPQALLVLMRRLFSWGKYREMLALRDTLMAALGEEGVLSREERMELAGECDLIMSFMYYNDIEGMSRLHRSACSKMTRPAISIRRYGSFTFGSPSVLMMFHRTPGELDAEVECMNRSMPFYYQVTCEHGAGAEQVMQAEALFMRGELAEAGLMNAKARCRAEERSQEYILLCCRLLELRMKILDGSGKGIEQPAGERERVKKLRDPMLLLSFDGVLSYCAALLGAADRAPAVFAAHELGTRNMLNPARPMLEMIENQVYLAQGEYETVIGRLDRQLEESRRQHYSLVELHLLLQAAGAYEGLGMRQRAAEFMRQALDAGGRDGIIMPFAENYRFISGALESVRLEDRGFTDRVRAMGELYEKRAAGLRRGLQRPAAAAELTDRELELARMAAERLSNREIAERLFLSEGTVKQYVSQIYSKLGIQGDTRTKRERLKRLLEEEN